MRYILFLITILLIVHKIDIIYSKYFVTRFSIERERHLLNHQQQELMLNLAAQINGSVDG